MFDGSHRTNKREINLSGASASARSSRAAHLNLARQQRLARAQAKARLNAVRVLQRCWRGVRAGIGSSSDSGVSIGVDGASNDGANIVDIGSAVAADSGAARGKRGLNRGRKGIAMALDAQFQTTVNEYLLHLSKPLETTNESNGEVTGTLQQQQQILSKAASLLAFRMTPPLIPFYASRHNSVDRASTCKPKNKILRGKKWDEGDAVSEERMRQDLLSMGSMLLQQVAVSGGTNKNSTSMDDDDDNDNKTKPISSIAARKLMSITLILLRQSFHLQSTSTKTKEALFDVNKREEENSRLVQLLNYLLGIYTLDHWDGDDDYFLWTSRPSDYYVNILRKCHVARVSNVNGIDASGCDSDGGLGMGSTVVDGRTFSNSLPSGGWMISLYLCFRDCFFLYSKINTNDIDAGGVASMDVDGPDINGNLNGLHDKRTEMQQLLLKWCCRVILHLATLDLDKGKETQHDDSTQFVLTNYQQGLALLACIIFALNSQNSPSKNQSWLNEQLNDCLSSLERYLKDQNSERTGGNDIGNEGSLHSSSLWSPILMYSLSRTISALPTMQSASLSKTNAAQNNASNYNISGLMKDFSMYSSNAAHPWMEALFNTLKSREYIVLNQVLSCARSCQEESPHQQHIFTYAVPIILHYTLQQHQDLAVLSSFAARGENIMAWIATNSTGGGPMVDSTTKIAVAATYDGEVSEDDSDDDGQNEAMQPQPQLQQQQQQQQQQQAISSSRRDTASTGRYSRADLQTLPKLDALYETHCLRAKKIVFDRLRASQKQVANGNKHQEVRFMVTLAEKIGKGEWMQQLGNSLFPPASPSSPTPPLLPTSLLVPSPSPPLQLQARDAYIGALSIIMTSCSGLKAGRNAPSPLLAKMAFYDPLLCILWDCSFRNLSLLISPWSPSTDVSIVAFAYDILSAFCDIFSHNLLAVNDDEFLEKYTTETSFHTGQIVARDIICLLKTILNDLYWLHPVLASDITSPQQLAPSSLVCTDPESHLRFKRARLILSGTKLWNSLYERWCRLYRAIQFCEEECWVFPHLASRGQHDSNPIIQSQVTTLVDNDGEDDNDSMEDISIASRTMNEGDNEATSLTRRGESSAATNANDAGSDALASSFRDPKMARVLTCIPQALPFSRRVNLFQSLLETDKLRTQDETAAFHQMMMNLQNSDGEDGDFSGREKVTIRRDSLYSDSMKSLNPLGKKLRKKVQVTFVNQHGTTEAGIDGGGVFKEFLDDLITDAFLPQWGKEEDAEEEGSSLSESRGRDQDFFSVTPLQTLQVNVATDGNDELLSHYEFLGRVLGKAIYESILVDPQYCLPFLNKLLGKQNSLDDLKNLDPEYYKNLKSLRYMSASDINNLGLTFEMTKFAATSSQFNRAHGTVELIPGGSNIPVTKENVIQYIHLVSHQRMNIAGARQTHAFLKGFRDLIPAPWVRLFSAYEFQKLISGDDAVKGIDVKGMMAVMRYSGGFHPSQPIVHWLWEIVDEMTPEQQRKFLKFMTSCSRQPLLGFQSLVPAPCVQQMRLREDDYGNEVVEGSTFGNIRLPTSSTCMNLLKLPKYPNKEMLRDKLFYAIESAAGFELS